MRKELREFILKGNLLQLAVAFIMGAAFGAVVKSFINDLIMPIIGKLVGNADFANLYINLSDRTYESAAAARDAGAAAIYYGAFYQHHRDAVDRWPSDVLSGPGCRAHAETCGRGRSNDQRVSILHHVHSHHRHALSQLHLGAGIRIRPRIPRRTLPMPVDRTS